MFLSEASAFEKYSRPLDEDEYENLTYDLKRNLIRIVDYKSIVDGFNDSALKNFAEDLQLHQEKLENVLIKWVEQKTIRAYCENIAYILKDKIQEQCKKNLLKAVRKLLTYDLGRQTLILVLCVEKIKDRPVEFFLGDKPHTSWLNRVYLTYLDDICEVNSLYRELSHWLHFSLGLQPTLKIVGNFYTDFEKKLFQLKEDSFYRNNASRINRRDECLLRENPFYPCNKMDKTLKVFDIGTTWYTLEELWNIIGFANVTDIIYINRLSELDLFKDKPVWGYNVNNDNDYLEGFLKEMREEGPKKPDEDAWEILLQLHRLPIDTQYM